ncbi:acyl-CoA dehydrogenase family protein [Blastococcus sp. SYSU D00695]
MSTTSTLGRTDRDDLLERARKVAPLVRAAADDVDANGGLTDEVVAALGESGLFWLGLPAELGGGDGTLVDVVRVIEEVAAADPSTGWSLMVNMDLTGFVVAHCPEEALADLFADGRPILAGSLARVGGGALTQEDGGWRLTGEYQFASGSAYATWFLASAATEDGTPKSVLVPRSHVEQRGNWDVLGLRGTGSQNLRISDYVAGPERVLDPLGPHLRGPSMQRMSIMHAGPIYHGGIALGVGRRAFELLHATVELEAARPGRTPLTEQSHFMVEFTRQEAAHRAARAYCLELAAEAQAVVDRDGEVTDLLVARLHQATAHATGVARDAVELAYSWSGTRALREPNPLAKLLRDVHGVTQHMIVGPGVVLEASGPILASYAAV